MFIEAMRRFPELTQIAIMMLTSVGQYADAERCRSLGISAYLTKPIRQHELQEAILRVLGNAKINNDTRPLITKKTVEDEPLLRVLLVEDNAVNQKVAQALLKKWNYRVIIAANGIEALTQSRKLPWMSCSWTCRCLRWTAFRRRPRFAAKRSGPGGTCPSLD